MTSWVTTVPVGTGKSENECAFRGRALTASHLTLLSLFPPSLTWVGAAQSYELTVDPSDAYSYEVHDFGATGFSTFLLLLSQSENFLNTTTCIYTMCIPVRKLTFTIGLKQCRK